MKYVYLSIGYRPKQTHKPKAPKNVCAPICEEIIYEALLIVVGLWTWFGLSRR